MEPHSKPPIYIITHEFFPTKGGIATFTEEMARAAWELGNEVEVWAPRTVETVSDTFPFPVRRLPLKGSQDLTCQIRLARELIQHRRDLRKAIVYLSDPGPILAMRYLQYFKAFRPRRLIMTFHGSEIIGFASNLFTRLAVHRLIRNADRLSTPSEFTHTLLRRNFPLAKRKTFLTPGALRSDFQDADRRKSRNPKKVHILTVGRLHPRKGQAKILEALAELPRQQRRQVSLWIVGSGNKFGYEDKLRQQAAELDFNITFFGDISNDELEDLYARADIFSMTSINFRKSVEGFGLVYLEAAAHGLPIVAHRIGGVAEAVSDGENGILVDPENPHELTAAFSRLILNRNLREQMGQNGRKWARRNNWLQSADLLFNRWDITIDPTVESELPSPDSLEA